MRRAKLEELKAQYMALDASLRRNFSDEFSALEGVSPLLMVKPLFS